MLWHARWLFVFAAALDALICGALLSSEPVSAQPAETAALIAKLRVDEQAFADAAARKDSVALQNLAWDNSAAAFAAVASETKVAPSTPEAKSLRRAHVACANAHSNIGMLAHVTVSVALSNTGGENAKVENEANRETLEFFLGPFHRKRAECAARSGVDLGVSPIAVRMTDLIPPFDLMRKRAIGETELAALKAIVSDAVTIERSLATAARGEPVRYGDMMAKILPVLALLQLHDDPELSRASRNVLKECNWMIGDLRSMIAELKTGDARPEIRDTQWSNAAMSLAQYRRKTKAACVNALGLGAAAAEVHIPNDAFGPENK